MLVGTGGGVAEMLNLAGVGRPGSSPRAPLRPLGPIADSSSDDIHAILLAAALVVGFVGMIACLVARRRPGIALALLAVGAAVAGAVSVFVAVNYVIVALGAVYLATLVLALAWWLRVARLVPGSGYSQARG